VTSAPPSGAPIKIKIGVGSSIADAPEYIAFDKGYFKQQGLDAELIPINNVNDTLPSLISGTVDFAGAAVFPSLFNAAAQGVPVKIIQYVSIGDAKTTQAGIIVRQDLIDSGRYKTPADLKGMVLGSGGAPGASLIDFTIEKIAAMGGIASSDIHPIFIPFPQQPAAFANKAIDAANMVEPFITIVEQQKIANMVIPASEYLRGYPSFVLMMSPVVAKQPQVADRFMLAYLKAGLEAYNALTAGKGGNADELTAILAKNTAVKNPKLIAKMTSDITPPTTPLDPKPLGELEDSLIKHGSVKQKVDVSQIVDGSYLARAAQELAHSGS